MKLCCSNKSSVCVFQKKLPSDSEVVCKPDLVYTVSAREYWQGNTLSKEETGNSWLYACDICARAWRGPWAFPFICLSPLQIIDTK